MSKRCKLQKEYFKKYGNYKAVNSHGKYSDHYVKWLEDQVLESQPTTKSQLKEAFEAGRIYQAFSNVAVIPDISFSSSEIMGASMPPDFDEWYSESQQTLNNAPSNDDNDEDDADIPVTTNGF